MNKVENMSKEEFYSIFNQETFDNFFAKKNIIGGDYIENLIKKLGINKLTDDKGYNINALYICDIIKILEHLQDTIECENCEKLIEQLEHTQLELENLRDKKHIQDTTEEKRDDDEMKSEMESAIQDGIHITEEREVKIVKDGGYIGGDCKCGIFVLSPHRYCQRCGVKIKRIA